MRGSVTVTLPPDGAHPERLLAIQLICRRGQSVERIVRVMSPGDPGVMFTDDGVPCETIWFIASGGHPCTAALWPDESLVVSSGWSAAGEDAATDDGAAGG